MAADETAPRRPYAAADAHECKQRAEEILGQSNAHYHVGRAVAWALLAVAAELHIIRKQMRR
ncbi:hypothetical protein ACWD4Z_22825 [Streptomyces antibioticus]